jgi:hypothetical protein
MRPAPILTATIVLMSVSACGTTDPAPAAAPPATSAAAPATPAASPAPTPATAAEAATACRLAAASPRTGEAVEIDETAIKAIIANAAKSGAAPVERAGIEVQARYATWLRAAIGDESATAMDDLLDAVGRLRSACTAAGVTAG